MKGVTNRNVTSIIRVQSCKMAIINISVLNPNVLLELELAFALGKPVINIKNRETKTISALGSVEYIECSHVGEF